MPQKKLHIVSFDVPYPPDYGGVMDIFYRIKALYELGWEITLHCFEYGRGKQPALEEFTKQVYYYKRKNLMVSGFSKLPLIVGSRNAKSLLQHLLKDDAPILFEGQHCTYFLSHSALKERTKIVRIHNIEHEYYKQLSRQTKNTLKKAFFRQEAIRLKHHEKTLAHANLLLCLTESDTTYYTQFNPQTTYLPVAFPLDFLYREKKENFSLFHGNLGVAENEVAVRWLVREVAPKLDHPLYIAGKSPSEKLRQLIQATKQVTLIENPNALELEDLLKKAKAHILPTFQSTGIKLKLLHALTTNAPVFVTPLMVAKTNVAHLCKCVETPTECAQQLNASPQHPISEEAFTERKIFLEKEYGKKRQEEGVIHLLNS